MTKLKLFTLLFIFAMQSTQAGNMMVRMRAINIMPDEKGTALGGNIAVNSESVPEIDFTYFVTDNFAFELIAATATHKVSLVNPTAVLATDANYSLGEVSLLPPTLLAQYHFTMGKFKPYVGAGINYTFFYGEDLGVLKNIEYDNSFGIAFQVGADYEISKDWFINFDVKRIAIKSDVTVTLYSNASVTTEVELNPVVAGLGIGHRF